jgi:hypothetical protein
MNYFGIGLTLLLISMDASSLPFFAIDQIPDNEKEQFVSDMNNLASIESDFTSKWLQDNLELDSSSGKDIVNFIYKKFPLVVGASFEYKYCEATAKSEYSCQKFPNGTQIQSAFVKYSINDGFATLAVPNSAFEDGSIDKYLVLSNGKKIPMTGLENSVLSINGNAGLDLGIEAAFWYRVSHYVTLSRAMDLIARKQSSPMSCIDNVGISFVCDKYRNGVNATLGVFLQNSAINCESCSDEDQARLLYISCKYLLSIDGNSRERMLGQRMFNQYKNLFAEHHLDMTELLMIYRASLTNDKEALELTY